MEVDTLCPVCQRRDEDGGHLFFQCKPVRTIWRTVGLEDVRLKCITMHDPLEVLCTILNLPNSDKTSVGTPLDMVDDEK